MLLNPAGFSEPMSAGLDKFYCTYLPTKKNQGTGELIRINFDQPCRINTNVKYTVWVKQNGPVSFRRNYIRCIFSRRLRV